MAETVEALAERALARLGVSVVPVANRSAAIAALPAATIATQALRLLAVMASDEDPLADDQALALAKVLAVNASLNGQAIVSWNSDAIPQAVSEEYTALTASHLAPSFGKAGGDLATQTALEGRIRRTALILRAPDLAKEAIMGVHLDLAGRGRVRWSVFDIPRPVEQPYVYLAAASLAAPFAALGVKVNPADVIQANTAIDRYISVPSSGEPVQASYL